MKQYRNKCRDIDTLKKRVSVCACLTRLHRKLFFFFSLSLLILFFFKANYNFLVFLWSLLILVLFHFYLLLRIFFLNIFFYSLKFVLSHFFPLQYSFSWRTHFWCHYFLAFFYNQLLTDNIFFLFKLLISFFLV